MNTLEKAGLLWFISAATYPGPRDGWAGILLLILMVAGVVVFLSGGAVETAIKERNEEEI